MLSHLALEGLTVCQLIFIQTRSQSGTPASNPDQVSLVDCFTNVENFDHFAALPWLRL